MKRPFSLILFLGVQLVVVTAFGWGYLQLSREAEIQFRETVLRETVYTEVPVERDLPLTVTPRFDDPSVVSDEDLAAVLKKIRPKFPEKNRKPNFVEHALRAWGINATFTDPAVMSGADMRDFLLDHSRYVASWKPDPNEDPGSRRKTSFDPNAEPLLIDQLHGVAINWGSRQMTSVHHDHLLACLSEAGVPRDQRVYAPSGRYLTLNDVLQESLRDFRPDERETEWSTMAFALWLPPTKSWQTKQGRTVTFDMLAERLMRGQKQIGVCVGTHRVYSLMLLWRLDQEYDILTDETSDQIIEHLKLVRDLIIASQFDDGHWPPNWPDGADAVTNPQDDVPYREVIATGHHLEWLAIAPDELQIPRERVQKAARWLVENTTGQTDEYIYEKYTFYSHVGNALALWRKTHPAEFWRRWTSEHPDYATATPDLPNPPAPDESKKPESNEPPVLAPKPE